MPAPITVATAGLGGKPPPPEFANRFRINAAMTGGNMLPPQWQQLAEYFFRSDTPAGASGEGLTNQPVPQQAYDLLAQAIAAGVVTDTQPSALGTGSPTPFGPIVGEYPLGLGIQWHQELLNRLKEMADQSGMQWALDPQTGQLVERGLPTEKRRQWDLDFQRLLAETTGVYQGTPTEEARQFNVTESGYLNGAPTLSREKWLAEQQQLAYERAAAPARAFENELARGAAIAQGQGQQPSLAANLALGQQYGQYGQYGTPAGVTSEAQLANAPVRVPAVVNAFRQGAGVPTAGQFGVASSVAPAQQAALTETDFRLQNQKQDAALTPNQRLILGSFGQAGGVSADAQEYYRTRGRPAAGTTTGGYRLT